MNNNYKYVLVLCLSVLASCDDGAAPDLQDDQGTAALPQIQSESSAQPGGSTAVTVPAHIIRGVNSPARTAEQIERDPARLPGQVLALAGLSEGDRIAEITAFGQYYSVILAEAIGPQGHLYMYDMPYLEAFGAVESGTAFAEAHANTDYEVVDYSVIQLPDDLDGVYNVLYYHDLEPQDVSTAELNEKIYNALRPGGRYLIVDHKAEDGSGWRDAATIHRMAKETIVEEVTAAGFELIADSDILAHPEDDRTTMVFNPGVRGGTDRAVLVFQKPR
ncbi:MAG: hypothetical protein WD601_00630 [Pseudohongiellaceae bacterium]